MSTQCILQVPSHALRLHVLPTCYTGAHRLRGQHHNGKTRFSLKGRYADDGQPITQPNSVFEGSQQMGNAVGVVAD
jgi:hypothetical protein